MNWLNDVFLTDSTQTQFSSGSYDLSLVAVSIILACTAAYFALYFASFAKTLQKTKYRQIAILSGSLVMGGGIWSMHFVGMLAYDMGHKVSYQLALTMASAVPSILASYLSLAILSRTKLTLSAISISGIFVGLGIGTMHYIGMAAMTMTGKLVYEPLWFILSLFIAIGLAIISLATHSHFSQKLIKLPTNYLTIISAIIMGLAISGMHYSGMTAARFIHEEGHIANPANQVEIVDQNFFLSIAIAIITLLLSLLATNITSKIRFRQLLNEKTLSELRLKTTLETAVDGIITTDNVGIIETFNKAAEVIFGWQADEVIGKDISILIPQDDQNSPIEEINRIKRHNIRSAIGTEKEMAALHKSGSIFPIRLAVATVDTEQNEPFIVGFITDISSRKALELAVKKREQEYSSLVENIPGATFRCALDEQWTCHFISDAIENMTEWKPDDFYQQVINLADIIHSEDLENTANVVNQAIENRHSYSVEYRLRHKQGHYISVLDTGSIVLDEDGEPVWIDGVLLDISSRVKMEEELREAKLKAEQSAHSKATFLANMSHEIRTPMNAIIGFSEILLDADIGHDNKQHLITVSKAARSLLHLLNDILDSAKLDNNKLEIEKLPFNLAATVDEVISTLWLQARSKGLELNFHLDNNLAQTYLGAEQRIRQVLMNLIGNAIKFTEHGTVTLTIQKVDHDAIEFVIEDTGIGIESDRLKSIFEPFTQADASTSRRFGGTGLGTSISKQLVNLMGGEISATSQIGIGSRFAFQLPLKAIDRQTETESAPVVEQVLDKKHVLIVDDVEQNLTLLELILKQKHHSVSRAKDGLEALKLFKTVKPDLVLMDIQMPNMDGLTASQMIRLYEKEQHLSATPIIALTANAFNEDRLAVLKAGMNGFANKPIDKQALFAEIDKVFANAPQAPNTMANKQITQSSTKRQIHLEKGLELWQDYARYLGEIEAFLQRYASITNQLQEAIKVQDYQAIIEISHAARGIAGNLALLPLSHALAQLEADAQQKNTEASLNSITKLDQSLLSLAEEYQLLIDAQPPETGQTAISTDLPNTPSATIEEIIQRVIETTEVGGIHDEDISQLIALANDEQQALADQAAKHLNDFEFTAALTILEQLREKLT